MLLVACIAKPAFAEKFKQHEFSGPLKRFVLVIMAIEAHFKYNTGKFTKIEVFKPAGTASICSKYRLRTFKRVAWCAYAENG